MRGIILSVGILLALQQAKADSSAFHDIPDWREDDHAKAWRVFHDSCAGILKRKTSSGKKEPALTAICADAIKAPRNLSRARARRFFEARFEPVKLTSAEPGLMTGYNEPELPASPRQTKDFSAPVLRRPADLVGEVAPPGHPQLQAARKLSDGTLVPYPDRAEIENGALRNQGLEIFWMRPFDLFNMQVQGSGRLRLANGKIVRLAYDGKNGQPYTSVGKALIDRGILQKGNVTMQAIEGTFKKDPVLARDIMRQNKSYVFFRVLENHDLRLGPFGAQGLPLTPHRSIAIDRDIHAYGLPFFIDGTLPKGSARRPFRQLVISQDTGTAIRGIGRIDLFTGSGREAFELAGRLQERVDLYLLRPKR